ncbi:Mu phage/prophage I family protein [Burkholderia sp. lig30]|jgi:phage I-like protein|uniref:phage protease n=1 Tax=Burkholderia sp. lig30 TaxID=1192124 RepID=UPI0004618850|nr:phage protease [Burkholderia sp. lig30]KDB09507.1 Mu phage/prophage I family protein [Burkholderia sp. lig30]
MANPLLIAALSAQIESSGSELKLLPAGDFRARDGRPAECAAWHMDAAIARQLIAAASVRETAYVVDYEHQTLNAATNGQPAPAAAWFRTLEWREGDGLYAIDVDWTVRASAMIDAKEYRYLSPVFAYDKSGNVTAILHAALTNNPALDCLDDVQLAAASMLAGAPVPAGVAALSTQPSGDTQMDELLEQLRWLLNMPVGATVDDVTAQLKKLIDSLSGGAGVAAASVNLPALLQQKDSQIATLSANQADPARFVPIAVMTDLRTQLAVATEQLSGNEVNGLVTAALSDGRLLPAQEAWARDLGKTNIASLKTYLSGAQPIAALTTTQTGGQPPAGVRPDAPTDDVAMTAVCKALGIDQTSLAKPVDANA